MNRVWESVAPIVPFSALPNQVSQIGPGVELQAIPDWFKREREYAEKHLGEREAFSSQACLKASFQAEGLGTLVKGPDGQERPNYELSWELIRMASLALWLARQSPLHVELVITAEPEFSTQGSATKGSTLNPIRPHPSYVNSRLRRNHLREADTFATAIQGLPHRSSLWTAIRFLWLALTQEIWETRYINLWVAVEALFGPDNRKRISKKLAKRVATFLNDDQRSANVAHEIVSRGYDWRSAAVHGSRLSELKNEESSNLMIEAEGIARTSLRKILQDPLLVTTFSSSSRDAYLNRLNKGFNF